MNKYRNTGGRLTGPNEALLEKLRRLYGGQAVTRDALGRRVALPSEIQRAIRGAGNNR